MWKDCQLLQLLHIGICSADPGMFVVCHHGNQDSCIGNSNLVEWKIASIFLV